MRKRRAFTLAEALISMCLIATILGAVASIFASYTKVMKHTSPHERNLIQGQAAINKMRDEVAAAISFSEPLPPSTSTYSRLIFEKIDPAEMTRLPIPPDAGAYFEPQDVTMRAWIEYSVTDGVLYRKVWGASSASWNAQEPLIQGVIGLTTVYRAPAGIEIRLNLQEDNSNRVLNTLTNCWIMQ